jgi:hypothetical protein
MFTSTKKPEMPTSATALAGRAAPIPTASQHFVNGRPLKGPSPEGLETPCSAWDASGVPSAKTRHPIYLLSQAAVRSSASRWAASL